MDLKFNVNDAEPNVIPLWVDLVLFVIWGVAVAASVVYALASASVLAGFMVLLASGAILLGGRMFAKRVLDDYS